MLPYRDRLIGRLPLPRKDRLFRFEVELFLTNGRTVTYQVPTDVADGIAARPTWIWPPGTPDDAKPAAAVFADILDRVNKRTGFLRVLDTDDRRWIVRADAILAYNMRDYQPPPDTHIGFEFVPEVQEL